MMFVYFTSLMYSNVLFSILPILTHAQQQTYWNSINGCEKCDPVQVIVARHRDTLVFFPRRWFYWSVPSAMVIGRECVTGRNVKKHWVALLTLARRTAVSKTDRVITCVCVCVSQRRWSSFFVEVRPNNGLNHLGWIRHLCRLKRLIVRAMWDIEHACHSAVDSGTNGKEIVWNVSNSCIRHTNACLTVFQSFEHLPLSLQVSEDF